MAGAPPVAGAGAAAAEVAVEEEAAGMVVVAGFGKYEGVDDVVDGFGK